ncbi:MAG: DNA gyrase inhibitor YacG [Gammaproteobacteria bacterium]|nr:DNA gyrase inhibitor YacG [Gammaproteobacteria bacterium]
MPPLAVSCPTCGRETAWSAASSWRPFCSERCRLIDLGAWLSEERAIPGSEPAHVAPDGTSLPARAGDSLADDDGS